MFNFFKATKQQSAKQIIDQTTAEPNQYHSSAILAKQKEREKNGAHEQELTYLYDRVNSRIACRIGGIGEFIGANEIYYRIRPIDRYKKALTMLGLDASYEGMVPTAGVELATY